MSGNLRSTANETFGRLVGVSKHANVRANSSETREMCSRERVADGVVPETSHNRKIYVRPKPGKKEDTSTVCRVAKTTFYYTTQTTSKKHYQFFRFSVMCTWFILRECPFVFFATDARTHNPTLSGIRCFLRRNNNNNNDANSQIIVLIHFFLSSSNRT